jgi:hypothetical protein
MPARERVIAVDWSGALRGAERRIWLAEHGERGLVRLEAGRSRAQLTRHLIECAETTPGLLVGLDFAFGFPRWFAESRGHADGRALWAEAAVEGERWLRDCLPPFWGRPGARQPPPDPARPSWRRTETEEPAVRGIRPKSVFQIGGAGSVGTGSLRGMPHLDELRRAGFAIWPFDAPGSGPVAMEIYPRQFTGPLAKSDGLQRALHLATRWRELAAPMREAAESSEDAFDAALSARGLYAARAQFPPPPWSEPAWERMEGRIFSPRLDPFLRHA